MNSIQQVGLSRAVVPCKDNNLLTKCQVSFDIAAKIHQMQFTQAHGAKDKIADRISFDRNQQIKFDRVW
jgi:hypothetical protein